MKKLFLLGLLFASVASQAATFTTNVLGTSNFLLTSKASEIYRIDVLGTNSQANVFLYDASTAQRNLTNAAYSNITASVGFITNAWTDVNGNAQSNVFAALIRTTNIVAAATNNIAPSLVLPTTANVVNSYDYSDSPVKFVRGVVVSNATTLTLVIYYRQ